VLTTFLEAVPDHPRALRLLGICYDKLGERERATQAYRRADLCLQLERARRTGARLWRPHEPEDAPRLAAARAAALDKLAPPLG
jgi:hypothetical protein